MIRGDFYVRPSRTFLEVYLGDVAETLLRCSVGAETPTFTQPPGFDEQRWIWSILLVHFMSKSSPCLTGALDC